MESSEKPPLPPYAEPVEGTLGRCPFCHDGIATDARWLVCERCLARHHTECWEESGECACCRFARVVEPPRRGRRGLLAALVGAGVGAAGVALALRPRPPSKEDLEHAERIEALLLAMPGAYRPWNFRASFRDAVPPADLVPRPVLGLAEPEPIVLALSPAELEVQRARNESLRAMQDTPKPRRRIL